MLTLHPERACIQHLLWQLRLDEALELEALSARLDLALKRLPGPPSLPLRVWRDEQDSQLLLVLSTGRLQLRLHYLIDPDERPVAAQRFVARLNALL